MASGLNRPRARAQGPGETRPRSPRRWRPRRTRSRAGHHGHRRHLSWRYLQVQAGKNLRHLQYDRDRLVPFATGSSSLHPTGELGVANRDLGAIEHINQDSPHGQRQGDCVRCERDTPLRSRPRRDRAQFAGLNAERALINVEYRFPSRPHRLTLCVCLRLPCLAGCGCIHQRHGIACP